MTTTYFNGGYIPEAPPDDRKKWHHEHKIPKADYHRGPYLSQSQFHPALPPPENYIRMKTGGVPEPNRAPELKQQQQRKVTENNGTADDNIVPNQSQEKETDLSKDYSLCSYFRVINKCIKNKNKSTASGKGGCMKNLMKKALVATIFLLYICFLVAVLLIESSVEKEDYWCRGDGFVIAITAIVGFFLIYFQILKPIFKKIWKLKKADKPNALHKKKSSSSWKNRCLRVVGYVAFIGAAIGFLVYDTADERERLNSLFGIVLFLVAGFLFSAAPRKVQWNNVIWGLGFQFCFGLLILRWPIGRSIFECFSGKVHSYLLFTDSGSSFIFGDLVEQGIFAFKVLSVILFFSMCIQILYYFGAMQWLVIKIGWLLQITVGTTACESINAAANIFLGQTEAPLLVKPYLPMMTKSELHAVMTGGFATIAGAVLAAFISFGVNAAHLMSASVMNAPTALAMSKLFYPETEVSQTNFADIKTEKPKEANVLHAAIEGISSAIPLVANIGANLLAFIAFIALVDGILNWGCQLVNVEEGVCSLSSAFGYVFMPLAFVMGVPWMDCYLVGQLIGTKIFVNEFVAYLKLADFMRSSALSKRAEIIATFALCGFGNISSIGIQIGGLGAMAPSRKADMAKIAVRALIAGSTATFMTACVAGTLLSSSVEIDILSSNSTGI